MLKKVLLLVFFLLLALPISGKPKPKRIISLMPNITEILFSLGLEKSVVAVSDFSNYPDATATKPRIGGQLLNIEKIAALKPDLIVGLAPGQTASLEKLKKLKFPVHLISASNLKALLLAILDLGQITGAERAAQKLTTDLRRRITLVAQDKLTSSPKTIILVWPNPFIAAGKNTFLDDLIKVAGGTNLAAPAAGAYPELCPEYLLTASPEVIIIPSEIEKKFFQEIKTNPILQKIRAVKNNRILVINGDILSRPGPRAIQALEIIHGFLKNG